MTDKLIARTWHYAHHPSMFHIQCPHCKENSNITWSEWQGHMWCYVCNLDIPIENSILNGPIPIGLAGSLGMRFDRIIIATGEFDEYNTKHNMYESEITVLMNRKQAQGLASKYK